MVILLWQRPVPWFRPHGPAPVGTVMIPTNLFGVKRRRNLRIVLHQNRDEEAPMKLNKMVTLLVFIPSIVVLGGCTVAKISGRGSIPLMLNNPPTRVQVIEQIEETKHVVFDYTSAFDASEVLAQKLARSKADAVINISITVQTSILDFVLNLITLGIANSKTFEISGQLVRAPRGLGSLSVPGSETVAESKNLSDLVPVMLQDSQENASSSMIVRAGEGDTISYKLVRYDSAVAGQ